VSGRGYRVVVPTRDSAGWIRAFHDAYRRLGVDPFYLFDTRSRDATHAILQDLGAEMMPVTPGADRAEAMLPATLSVASGDWIVRFDDDELPSAALLAWLDRHLDAIAEPCLALSRRDVLIRDGQLCFSRMEHYYFHPHDPTFLDPQWRGFRPAHVRFSNTLHTPGFAVETFHTAPQSAYFVHFDWMLRTYEQRIAKLRRYESQSVGGGWGLAQYYLPELHHPESVRWTPMDTQEFDPLLSALGILAPEQARCPT
jgi:hypothetical protein